MKSFSPELKAIIGEMGIQLDPDDELRLDNVLFLMPEIGEKMFWDKYTPQIRGQRFYKKQMKVGWVGHSHLLLDAFLEGGYPKSEEYIMSIITREA